MPERPNGAVSKTVVSREGHRGFKSHSLRPYALARCAALRRSLAEAEGGVDLAGRGRAVECVEVQTRRASVEELLAQPGGLGDADAPDRVGVVLDRVQLLGQPGGELGALEL